MISPVHFCPECDSGFTLVTLARMEAEAWSISNDMDFVGGEGLEITADVFCPLCWREKIFAIIKMTARMILGDELIWYRGTRLFYRRSR